VPRKRILAVDDEPELLKVIRERLGSRYDVDIATSATAAVQAIDRQRPDLVLLDLNMPDVNGLTLLKFLRRANVSVPVIVLTGNPSVAVAEQCLRHGAFAYAPKPINLAYLEHLVVTALGD
jgi:CheY-like chemotaxis protein